MPLLHIPRPLRRHAGGQDRLEVVGSTVREALAAAGRDHPALEAAILSEGELRPEFALAVDDEITDDGLGAKLDATSEIHLLPALGGG